ncbi:MAG: DNA-directed RNA polymerase subunit A'' [Candidatus Nanoarchaeia archaeon]|nr:DNA-directed RNA polymerase subunit A'' [Candidatus Nanoarchaeia archaeon]
MIEDYKEKIPAPLIEKYLKLIKDIKITKEQEKQILDRLEKEYNEAKIAPGESIGVITAESFGEPGTQMTLNVFHFAGVAEVQVTLGLPRLIELFDARKTVSTPAMEIYLHKKYSEDVKYAKIVASLIKETQFKEVVSSFSINVLNLQVECELNKKNIRDLKIKDEEIVEALNKGLKGVNVKLLNKGDTIVLKPNSEELKDVYKLKEKAKDVFIRGIPGITQVLPIKQTNEFVILTAGSNLKEVIKVPEVDETRTRCNNIFEMYEVFGVEAARNTIIEEAKKVIQDQGLDIDIRHIMFIADLMCVGGDVKGITRSGITGEKESVLARASFETPIKHLIDAAIIGEEDSLSSVIENVILNQPVPLGTGLPGLVVKMAGEVKDEKSGRSTEKQ